MPELKETFNADGTHGSPVLPANIKNLLIDIDGTICEDVPNEEPERMRIAAILPNALEFVNKWYDEGHIICFFTSRLEAHRAYTEEWLSKHGFKYHSIIFGKPRGGNYHWIDDRTVRATKFLGKFSDFIEVEKTVQIFEP